MYCPKCNSARYHSDSFCPACGYQYTQALKITQCHDIDSALANIKADLPESEVFTGVVTDTLRYKRIVQDEHNNLEYGYWWLTLSDGENTRQISVSSESELEDSLNKGDIVTIYRPESRVLLHDIQESWEHIVTNDDFASAIIKHGKEGQRSSMRRTWEPDPLNTADILKISLVSALIAVVVGFFTLANFHILYDWPAYAMFGGAVFALISHFLMKKDKKRYNAQNDYYQTIRRYLGLILDINIEQLNGINIQRPRSLEDKLCCGCESRLENGAAYCCQCGCSQSPAIALPSANANASSDTGGQIIPVDPGSEIALDVQLTQPVDLGSVKSQVLSSAAKLLEPCEEEYKHEFGLGSALKGTMSSDIVLGTVIDRDLSSNVNSWQHKKVRETTYTNKYGNTRTETEVIYRKDHRRSNVNGYLVIQTLDGEEMAYNPGSGQLTRTDVGDHVVIARSRLTLEKDKEGDHSYQQFYYNLSKAVYWESKGITAFSRDGYTAAVVFLLLIATGVSYFYVQPAAIVCGILATYLMLTAAHCQKTNKTARQKFSERFNGKLEQVHQKCEKWARLLG